MRSLRVCVVLFLNLVKIAVSVIALPLSAVNLFLIAIKNWWSTQVSPWVDQITVRTRFSPNCADSYQSLLWRCFTPSHGSRKFLNTIKIAANYDDGGPSLNDINIAGSRWGGIPLPIHLYLYPSLPKLDVTPSTSGTYNFGIKVKKSLFLIYKLFDHTCFWFSDQ